MRARTLLHLRPPSLTGWGRRKLGALLLVLGLALLGLQSLGLVHPLVHGLHGANHGTPSAHDGAHTDLTSSDYTAASFWQRLLPEHASDGDCLNFDQLCHGDALAPAVLALVCALPLVLACVALAQVYALRRYTRFHARAPPAVV